MREQLGEGGSVVTFNGPRRGGHHSAEPPARSIAASDSGLVSACRAR
jgi:hypothetical protein